MSVIDFHYGETHYIWTYCVHLGPYEGPDGYKYDLGIYEGGILGPSFAIVVGPEPHEYMSGPITYSTGSDAEAETLKRYKEVRAGRAMLIEAMQEFGEQEDVSEEMKNFLAILKKEEQEAGGEL